MRVIDDGYLLKKDEVNVDHDLPRVGDFGVQEMKDDVHEQSIKNVEVDDDIDVYVKEMKDEMEKVHDDLYARVLEMMDQLQGKHFLVNTA
ncbi:hypothetical protein L1987_26751 [Smallanthus sonchifolius]|uniref:Uncharacterized protein n=1 Tax=Smallanthus sonchifolius TaxID=185202 RepID=A0ACB9IA53_9ASTR|nr:hypothetical protein L1987_26751 [Smallanthus sonchifolius]